MKYIHEDLHLVAKSKEITKLKEIINNLPCSDRYREVNKDYPSYIGSLYSLLNEKEHDLAAWLCKLYEEE